MKLEYPNDFENKILCGDCIEVMGFIPDNSIDLIVGSPPYNVNLKYDNSSDDLSEIEYIGFIKKILSESERILVSGGRIALIVGNAANKTKRRDFQHFGCKLLSLYSNNNISPLGLICWNKSITGNSTAWGSWMSPSAPSLRSVWESIVIGQKSGKFKIKNKIDITREEFLKWTCDLWNISPSRKPKVLHPASFPLEIPYRLIKLYTSQNDIILDPFIGSGTTAIACKDLNRNYIGIDISSKYVEMSKQRLSQTTLNDIKINK